MKILVGAKPSCILQRIKLLSLESPVLIADAEALNLIETKILRAKQEVFIAREAAAGGTIAPATDRNIFLSLADLQSS